MLALLLLPLLLLIASCRPGAAEQSESFGTATDDPLSGVSRPSTGRARRAPDGAPKLVARDAAAAGGASAAERPRSGVGTKPHSPAAEADLSPHRSVDCARETALAPGECRVHGAGPALVVRGVVIAGSTVFEGGSVRIGADGRVECAACDCSEARARVVTCSDAVVSPGFLNLHDHVTYAGTPPLPDVGERYEHRHEWRLGLDGHHKLVYSGRASDAEVLAHELRMLMSGVTSLLGAGGEQGLVRNLELDALSGLGAMGITLSTFPLGDSSGSSAGQCTFGARRDRAEAVGRSRAYVPHLGEGIDLLAQSEIACSASGAHDLLGMGSAVIHAVGITAREAALLADSGASVVWSPRSNVSLYGNTAPIPLLRRLGVPLALGTDWLASGSMNLLRELACAEALSSTRFGGELSSYDLFSMVTYEAALAIRADGQLGSLREGRAGDLVVFAAESGADPFAAVVRASPAGVRLVVRGGRVLYGDGDLVAGLSGEEELCEDLDVCGARKRACVAEDTGRSLAEIRAAGEAVYPLVLCAPDATEPSCDPVRPGEYGAISAEDRDGDGVQNGADLCPDVFDPARPLDGSSQADSDADGVGDACDACPLSLGETCFRKHTLDRDRDGIPDAADACPFVAELAAADTDADGHGDACDHCPTPNPGATPCPLGISALRDPSETHRPPLGSPVELEGWVTAVRPDGRGFFLQDRGSAYSGIEVYASAGAPAPSVGERVRVVGTTHRYEDRDELLLVSLDRLELAGDSPAPLEVDAASIADGGALSMAYEGLLVRVTGVVVVSSNADGANDYDESLLEAGLRLDDRLLPELDNTYPEGTRLDVTAVLGRSFGHNKLWPRSWDDVLVR